jgi:hypothetical protein
LTNKSHAIAPQQEHPREAPVNAPDPNFAETKTMLAEMSVEMEESKRAAGGSISEVAAGWITPQRPIHLAPNPQPCRARREKCSPTPRSAFRVQLLRVYIRLHPGISAYRTNYEAQPVVPIPHSAHSLSEWRRGGYAECLRQQETPAMAQQLVAETGEIQPANAPPLTDRIAKSSRIWHSCPAEPSHDPVMASPVCA